MKNQTQNILVLMAVYNSQKYIEEQLLSILHQTYPFIHIVISDDCSKDSSVEIIQKISQKFPNRITLLTSIKNEGIIGNFSKLIHYANADYVMLSDGDDVWLPNKVELTLNKMVELEKSSGKQIPLLVHTDLIVVDRHLKTIHRSFWDYSHYLPQRHQHLNRQLAQNVITGCTVMFNRPLLELAKPIPKDIIMHDWWLGLVALAFGKVDIVKTPTMLYRQHGSNDTGAKKYGILSYIKNIYKKKPARTRVNTYFQAKVFLDQFSDKFNQEQIRSIKAFLQKEQCGFFSRLFLTHKHGFYKHGLLRNLKELFNLT